MTSLNQPKHCSVLALTLIFHDLPSLWRVWFRMKPGKERMIASTMRSSRVAREPGSTRLGSLGCCVTFCCWFCFALKIWRSRCFAMNIWAIHFVTWPGRSSDLGISLKKPVPGERCQHCKQRCARFWGLLCHILLLVQADYVDSSLFMLVLIDNTMITLWLIHSNYRNLHQVHLFLAATWRPWPGQEPQAEPQDQSALAWAPHATEAEGGGSFGQGPHHAQSGATLDGGRFHGGHLTESSEEGKHRNTGCIPSASSEIWYGKSLVLNR